MRVLVCARPETVDLVQNLSHLSPFRIDISSQLCVENLFATYFKDKYHLAFHLRVVGTQAIRIRSQALKTDETADAREPKRDLS